MNFPDISPSYLTMLHSLLLTAAIWEGQGSPLTRLSAKRKEPDFPRLCPRQLAGAGTQSELTWQVLGHSHHISGAGTQSDLRKHLLKWQRVTSSLESDTGQPLR